MIKKAINGHTKKELKNHFAGKYIDKQLPYGRNVSVFEKISKNWWKCGEIYKRKQIIK